MVPSITDQQSSKPNRPWANLGQLAVLAVWILCEPHLPWITVEPNSMSKGIQSVLNHHSKRREGGEGGGDPALFEHPLNGLHAPTSKTEGSSHARTFSLQRILNQVHSFTHAHIQTNTLSKHTHTCTDNSCFSVAHSHRQTMSSSPLAVHPSPSLTSLLLPPALLLSLSSLLWELW